MRPPRLILLLACFVFIPILLTAISLLSASSRHGTAATSSDSHRQTSRFRALFSFHAPSALFPPSAIISLTEDNSTFFLARPAAFGPLLPLKGLSGPLWIGSGFSDDALRKGGVGIAAEGELGCSDVPGWDDGNKNKNVPLGAGPQDGNQKLAPADGDSDHSVALNSRQKRGLGGPNSQGDGTDDHLHRPLPQANAPNSNGNGVTGRANGKPRDSPHADIQSLQESAEISGKVVLLSRGGCGFLEKVKWVQRRGGVALIVGDDTRGGGLVTMYARGDTSNVTIPAVFTSYTTAHLLSSLVPQGSTLDNSKLASGKWQTTQRKLNLKNAKSDKHTNVDKPAGNTPNTPQPGSHDDFVIGVQDWRDPDLVPVKASTSVQGTATPKANAKTRSETGSKAYTFKQASDPRGLEGGSTTPRSGEYRSAKDSLDGPGKNIKTGGLKSPWWKPSFRLHGSKEGDNSPAPKVIEIPPEAKQFHGAAGSVGKGHAGNGDENDHEGLWVTLTPTSMSTSPFFDTLLVLVVSPLITLTVVYALLLLRSRIRRRRWRAPKAIVDRLPVRTYHTMPTISTPNTPSPDGSSPSSPLLSHSRPHSPRPRPRSQTCGPVSASSNSLDPGRDRAEKPRSGSTLWRRKYTGRQVECVVCLEETPWLTTRRRTCPICKGDVVRSLGPNTSGTRVEQTEPMSDDGQARIAETRNDSPTSAVPIPDEDLDSDLERGVSPSASLLDGSRRHAAAPSSWRNLANLSLSALSGDSMWHQPRHTGSHRNR
ncbi:predicted protein [Uncinocarpus reesii 1704]|uniref:PA domain-containing protein n=1 Tax=Uncinocarpus reesii (strain UAMH 1704) TaxID=336963 RepID=C4JST2_UNCRE|nr:uncharacterized protein UREG_05521 [Uncinocarpus reesii 1704]EEP80679.1 predicted protein [Uncinocarpus reesii 1704]